MKSIMDNFNEGEKVDILEIARLALGSILDDIAELTDEHESFLVDLREKIQAVMDESK